jgi:glycosyltransferase involved in cell wall biosynthesis
MRADGKSMKVLIFSQYFWPESFRINDVAKSLCAKGLHVEVVTGKPNYPNGVIFDGYKPLGYQLDIHDGVVIHRIPLLARGRGALRLLLNYISFVISGLLFSPWVLRRKRFDVIFVYGLSPILQAIPAIFMGWMKGIPVVLWVQDLWPESLSATGHIQNKVVLKLVEHVVRFIYRHVDLLLVQSQAFIEPVSALASSTPVKYYPNSVDESFFAPTTTGVPAVSGLRDGFSVMFAGNIGSAQAVDVIIEAATLLQEYTDIHFVILGDGSRRDWMLQETNDRGLSNFHLPGRFSVETMPGFMKKASALLVTLSDQDIFAITVPNKIQAYMAVGRPILACLNGEGARLVIEADAGLAVPAEDAKKLADAVLQLYRMSAIERERLGSNGRHYYKEHFDHDKLVVELINHFQAVLQNRGELS